MKKQTNRIVHIYQMAFHNLSYYRRSTRILFLLIVVVTISVFGGKLSVDSMEQGIRMMRQRIGADLIVVPDKYVSSIQNALFEGIPSTVYFEKEWADRLATIPGVGQISYQLYISSLNLGCCDGSNQMIAIDPKTDFSVMPWAEGENDVLQADEVIAGSAFGKKQGDIVTYFNRKFTVRKVLEETGMGYDNSIFLTYQTAYDIVKDPEYRTQLGYRQNEPEISAVLLKVADGYTLAEVEQNIRDTYNNESISVYSSGELVGALVKSFEGYKIYGRWFEILFLLLGFISIFAVYRIHIEHRSHELACLISIGFSYGKILQMLFYELFAIVLSASILGSFFTGTVMILFRYALRDMITVPILLPDMGRLLLLSLKTILCNLLVSMTSYFYTVICLRRTEPALLLKERVQ